MMIIDSAGTCADQSRCGTAGSSPRTVAAVGRGRARRPASAICNRPLKFRALLRQSARIADISAHIAAHPPFASDSSGGYNQV